MANVQTYFNKFHDTIRRSYDDNSTLREKRDLLLGDLREGLRRYAQNHNIRIPRFDSFNQGSYAIGTGIEPLPGDDYDIDVGLNFHFSKNDYSPVEVKKWVYEALHTGNRTVEYKRPCVRVQYHRAGEELYHVDLAVYSGSNSTGSNSNWDNRTYLAKGFLGSAPENQVWEPAEPKRLIETFQQKFQHQGDQNQFRRVIRFLKRWKDINFSANGNERPTGIAMTACAMNWFQVQTTYNLHTQRREYDDFTALKNLVGSILNQFNFGSQISVYLPVPPRNDLFEKMSDRQMKNFKIKLAGLYSVDLGAAEDAPTDFLACSALRRAFGDDFPLPE